jgi:hypothetical protein
MELEILDLQVASDLSGLALTLSYCIPSTCRAKDFEEIFNSYLQDMELPLMATIAEEYCQTNEGKSLATEDWILCKNPLIYFVNIYLKYDLWRRPVVRGRVSKYVTNGYRK